MEEKYQKFLDFNWSDERWQAYLAGLYPPPAYKQVQRFKKKWYKKNVDPEFDDAYDPDAAAHCGAASCGSSCGSSAGSGAGSGTAAAAPSDEAAKWRAMGMKAAICAATYAAGLALAVGSMVGVCDNSMPLGLLAAGFVTELLFKHPFRFKAEFLQGIVNEDVGILPFMAPVVLAPGLHRAFRSMALVPFGLAAASSLAMAFRHSPGLPGFIGKAVTPLTEVSVRYQMMQARADAEVGLGFAMVFGAIAQISAPLAPLLFWNILSMRYAISPWTQASFRKVDALLSPVLGRIPGVSTLYSKLKEAMYGFAVRRSGAAGGGDGGSASRCSVM